MAQVGLRDLYIAEELSDTPDGATYGTPERVIDLMTANIEPQTASGSVPADDGIALQITQLNSIQVTVGLVNLPAAVEAKLLGRKIDKNGAIGANVSDSQKYYAIGFRSEAAGGSYTYYWFYKGTFAPPSANLQSKGNDVNIVTPSLVGTFIKRIFDGQFFYKINDKEDGVKQTAIQNWFNAVYSPAEIVAPTGLTLNDTESSVEAGADVQLTATVTPEDAANKTVHWSSSNTDVATVDSSGKVHGVAEGTAVIVARLDADASILATNIVTVTAPSGG